MGKAVYCIVLQVIFLIGCGRNAKLSTDAFRVSADLTGLNGHVVFYQRSNEEIDVIIVNDNSGSMASEQEKMGQRFPSFLVGLGHLPYHLAITTTDVSNGRYGLDGRFVDLEDGYGNVLTYQTPHAEHIFQSTIVRQESLAPCSGQLFDCPSQYERPILALIRAMERHNSDHTHFFRRDADLIAIIISDEDEPNAGENIHFGENKRIVTPDDAIETFQSIWGIHKNFTVYGIIIKPNVGRDREDESCLIQQNNGSRRFGTARYGRNIAELVRKTGGDLGSICDSDYASALRGIGQRSRRMLSSVQLPHIPSGDVQVLLNQRPLPPGTTFSIAGNKLSLQPTPPVGTRIDVYYQYQDDL